AMTNETRLSELIARWRELRRLGQPAPAEDLCRDCPELLDELRRRIEAVESSETATASTAGPPAAPDAEAGQPAPACRQSLGRYRLETLLGRGGFGEVWRAFDPDLLRPVAVKVPRPDRFTSPEQLDLFLVEARKAARLEHPGILPVHDVGR